MTFSKICPISNNQVTITLPLDFKDKKKVFVIIDDQLNPKSQKIELLKLAMKDPLFLTDLKEIHQDFDFIDNGTL